MRYVHTRSYDRWDELSSEYLNKLNITVLSAGCSIGSPHKSSLLIVFVSEITWGDCAQMSELWTEASQRQRAPSSSPDLQIWFLRGFQCEHWERKMMNASNGLEATIRPPDVTVVRIQHEHVHVCLINTSQISFNLLLRIFKLQAAEVLKFSFYQHHTWPGSSEVGFKKQV